MKNAFGDSLRHYRKRAKLSQRAAAAEMGATQRAWAAYEDGSRIPTLTMAVKLAKAVGMEFCWYFFEPRKK